MSHLIGDLIVNYVNLIVNSSFFFGEYRILILTCKLYMQLFHDVPSFPSAIPFQE